MSTDSRPEPNRAGSLNTPTLPGTPVPTDQAENRAPDSPDWIPRVAGELELPLPGVRATLQLLKEGATVPFIARYRKEATGGLDEVQIRAIEERHGYVVELEQRRQSVISEISRQGKLTDELRRRLEGVQTKAELEDLYLPYKPKRRTRATIARERGLLPLAEAIWQQGDQSTPEALASSFVDSAKEVPDIEAALKGARDICAERISEDAKLRKHAREMYFTDGQIEVEKAAEHADKPTKFDNYHNFAQPLAQIPSHRFLAIRRGEAEGILRANLKIDEERLVEFAEQSVPLRPASPFADQLRRAVRDGIQRQLLLGVQVDVRVELKLRSDREAIDVFAQNLRELLLAAPYGSRSVLGIDPGQRTGCKCVVVDETGKLLASETIYLVQGDHAMLRARQTLRHLCTTHAVMAVAVGNGTHGRETEAFVRSVLSDEGLSEAFCVSVNEAGASVYSASDVAREEFPDLDLTVRGAISIARRLQDPLAELVKIDPKSIGVGQYQHDVNPQLLGKKLDEVVESCVNSVGVELNTASAPLLARVAGVGPTLARRIISHRNQHGPFKNRRALLKVVGLGPKTFEQAAGFLRIREGDEPLDASAVHPERYALVQQIALDLGVTVQDLLCNAELLRRIDLKRYHSAEVGTFTLDDIMAELTKPGRDPRATFEPPKFREDVRSLEDVKVGMSLEGVVTNVTAFGAFVDIGVHQDGLVHVSELADRFIKTPSEVVKVGDKLTVRVLEVDLARRRIGLSARSKPREAHGGASQAGSQMQRPNPGQQWQGTARPSNQRSGSSTGGRSSQGSQFQYNPFADLARRR